MAATDFSKFDPGFLKKELAKLQKVKGGTSAKKSFESQIKQAISRPTTSKPRSSSGSSSSTKPKNTMTSRTTEQISQSAQRAKDVGVTPTKEIEELKRRGVDTSGFVPTQSTKEILEQGLSKASGKSVQEVQQQLDKFRGGTGQAAQAPEVIPQQGITMEQLQALLAEFRQGLPQGITQDQLTQAISGAREGFTSDLQKSQQETKDFIEQLRQSQVEAGKSSLEKALGRTQSALEAEREQLTPQFQEARTQQRTEALKGARGFGEFLAARGLGGGAQQQGAEQQAEIARQVALQGALGQLGEAEQTALSDIARRGTLAEQAFGQDVAALEAGAQSQALQNLINQQNIDRQFALQRAGLTGTLDGQQTLGAQQLALDAALRAAGLTGQLGGVQTLAGRQLALQEQQAGLQTQQIEQALRLGDINEQQAQFALDQLQDPNSVTNQANQVALEIQQLQLGALPEQLQLGLEQMRKQIQQIGASPVLSEAQRQQQELNLRIAREQLRQMQIETNQLSQPQSTQFPIGSFQQGLQGAISQVPKVISPVDDETLVADPVATKNAAADFIVVQNANGLMSDAQAQQLIIENGLTAQDIREAEKRTGVLAEDFARTAGQTGSPLPILGVPRF